MIHVTAVQYVRDKIVWLSFDDGVTGEVDLADLLVGSVFDPLQDTVEFKKVTYSEEIETIIWANGADFAPEFLHELFKQQVSDKRSA